MLRYRLFMGIGVAAIIMCLGVAFAQACLRVDQHILHIKEEAAPSGLAKPVAPTIAINSLHRGQAPRTTGGEIITTSCDDLGWLRLKIEPEQEDLGYIFRVRSGVIPDGFEWPGEPVRTN